MNPRPRALAAVVLTAFLARAAACWFLPAPPAEHRGLPNPDNYVRLGLSLLEHGSLLEPDGRWSAEREPVYPAFLAAGLSVARSARWLQFLQCLVGAGSVWLFFFLARRVLDERGALLASAFFALHPQYLFYAATPMRETVQAAVLLLGLLALARAAAAPSARVYALAGAASALAPLTNSAFLPWALGAAPLGVLWVHRAARRLSLAWCAAFLAGAAPLYGTWVARNYARFGTLVLGATTGGGGNLYMYLIVPNDAAGTPEQARIAENDPGLKELAGLGLSPVESDKWLYRRAVARIAREPGRFLGLCAGRFFKLWRPVPYKRDYGHNWRLIVAASLASDAWMIPAAVAGVFVVGLAAPEAVFLHLFVLSTSAVFAVLWAMVRYRLPLMLAVFVFAAAAVMRLWDRLRGGR
ncbi:hypothetical protein EPO15_08880 [bacterium]|nr:MAG: hypothetical protein EPO15_08880 [bacterium]